MVTCSGNVVVIELQSTPAHITIIRSCAVRQDLTTNSVLVDLGLSATVGQFLQLAGY